MHRCTCPYSVPVYSGCVGSCKKCALPTTQHQDGESFTRTGCTLIEATLTKHSYHILSNFHNQCADSSPSLSTCIDINIQWHHASKILYTTMTKLKTFPEVRYLLPHYIMLHRWLTEQCHWGLVAPFTA